MDKIENGLAAATATKPNGCLVVFFVAVRIAAGAAILVWLAAPRWAVAAWLMLHVKVRLFYPRDDRVSSSETRPRR